MRIDDSPGLFGAGIGTGTSGDLKCGVCGMEYNIGADAAEDYEHRESVGWANFAGMTVADCCFEDIEAGVLAHMDDILTWYAKIVKARRRRVERDEARLAKTQA